jgi:hypothetical protein
MHNSQIAARDDMTLIPLLLLLLNRTQQAFPHTPHGS